MPSRWVFGLLSGFVLTLGGCTSFGGVSRSVQSREAVTIADRACVLTEYRHEQLSINGTHAWIETRAECGGRVIDCALDTRAQCIARVGQALAGRS